MSARRLSAGRGCLRLGLFFCLRLRGACQHGQGGEDRPGGEPTEDGTEITAHDRGPLFKRAFFESSFASRPDHPTGATLYNVHDARSETLRQINLAIKWCCAARLCWGTWPKIAPLLALQSFLDGLDLLLHGRHVDTRALLNGQELRKIWTTCERPWRPCTERKQRGTLPGKESAGQFL